MLGARRVHSRRWDTPGSSHQHRPPPQGSTCDRAQSTRPPAEAPLPEGQTLLAGGEGHRPGDAPSGRNAEGFLNLGRPAFVPEASGCLVSAHPREPLLTDLSEGHKR